MPPELQGTTPEGSSEDTNNNSSEVKPETLAENTPALEVPKKQVEAQMTPETPTPQQNTEAPKAEPAIPTSFNNTPSLNTGGGKKVLGGLLILLLIGIIGVGAVFASRFFGGSVDTQTLLLEAMNKYVAQDNISLNTTLSTDFITNANDLVSEEISGNITLINDNFVSGNTFETTGNAYLSVLNGAVSASMSYLYTEDNMYLMLDDFNLQIDENTPEALTFLAFLPTDLFKGQWLQIPVSELAEDEPIEYNGKEYESVSAVVSDIRQQITVASETEIWTDLFTNQFAYNEEMSGDGLYAYSSSFTPETFTSYIETLGLNFILEDIRDEAITEAAYQEDLASAVDIINNTLFYITENANLSYISLANYSYSDENTETTINMTVSTIEFKDIVAPESFVGFEEFVEQVFGGFGF